MGTIKQEENGVLREGIRGGEGSALFFPAPIPDKNGAVTMAARIELEAGGSVGFHLHDKDEEVYAILSGEGVLQFDGGECPALPGDLFVTRQGMSHGLRNTGKSPLVFFAVVAEK